MGPRPRHASSMPRKPSLYLLLCWNKTASGSINGEKYYISGAGGELPRCKIMNHLWAKNGQLTPVTPSAKPGSQEILVFCQIGPPPGVENRSGPMQVLANGTYPPKPPGHMPHQFHQCALLPKQNMLIGAKAAALKSPKFSVLGAGGRNFPMHALYRGRPGK